MKAGCNLAKSSKEGCFADDDDDDDDDDGGGDQTEQTMNFTFMSKEVK
jgi:hypothetical protein